MPNLQYRQSIIQEKRKFTPRRKFVMEIASRYPMIFSKDYGKPSRFPKTGRIGGVFSYIEFEETMGNNSEIYAGDFYGSLAALLSKSSFPYFLHRGNNENCDYSDIVAGGKNCYLSMTMVADVENVAYSRSVKNNCDTVLSSTMVRKNCSQVFESACIINSSNIFYSHTMQNCFEMRFCKNCINCSNCIMCNGLENVSYMINNKQYMKDEYEMRKRDILKTNKEFGLYKNNVHGKEGNQGSENCFGDGIVNSRDVTHGYYINQITVGNNIILFGSAQDSENIYDVLVAGSPMGKDFYGGLSLSGEHLYCSCHCAESSHIFYSYYLSNCSFCLGCIGLKNKSYCILNKQYTKEERYEKVDKIFGQMHGDGLLGDFFPATMNPFYFNDTAAYLIDPTFTKEEVMAAGYLRRDEPIKVDIPADAKIVKWNELDRFEGWRHSEGSGAEGRTQEQGNLDPSLRSGGQSSERTIDSEILKYVIQDEQGNYYRIIPMEYKFLMKHALPLPRKHRLERMKENFRIV